jgi:hypothetical protein
MSKDFNFSQNYYKLTGERFAVVRGLTRAKQYKVGEIVQLNLKGESWGKAEIFKIDIVKVKQITNMKWIRHFCSFKGFRPESVNDFVGWLNNTRHAASKLKSDEERIVIFHLKKYRG